MHRLLTLGALAGLLVLSAGCGGSSSLDNTEAVVFLTVEVKEHNPEVNVCTANSGADLTIVKMEIESKPKSPGTNLSSNQDVNLRTWEITPSRIDGGTTVSPSWQTNVGVFVEAGGLTLLENYRVYPVEFLDDPPFNYLFPENGGVDPETGNAIIRESLRLVIYGRTVSGKTVATEPTSVEFRFSCN